MDNCLPIGSIGETDFFLEDCIVSQTAKDNNIDNWFDKKEHAQNCFWTMQKIYIPIRRRYKFTLTSFYRNNKLNEKVGGQANSQHCLGQAIDIVPIGLSCEAFFNAIKATELPYDQLILEYPGTVKERVHISYDRGKKEQRRDAFIGNYGL